MKFDVYCDEAYPDLLGSKKSKVPFLVIGSIWAHREDREQLKRAIHVLRDKHKVGGEFKWKKVSASRLEFYKDLIRLFFSAGDRLRFRCIAVDRTKVDLMHLCNNDHELGFYKFYYNLLHHWIHDFNKYAIFCDYKKNQDMGRLKILRQCLSASNLSASMENVQAVCSDESVMIQMADVLIGAASAKLNGTLNSQTAKSKFVEFLESKLGHEIVPTSKGEAKFNVFAIDPNGGW